MWSCRLREATPTYCKAQLHVPLMGVDFVFVLEQGLYFFCLRDIQEFAVAVKEGVESLIKY